MPTPRLPLAGLITLSALLALAPAAPAARAKAQKPSVKISGLSVNQVFSPPGTKIPYPDSQNRCYRMGGPSGAPPSVTVYGFVKGVKIPASAPTTVVFTTPWTAQFGAQIGTTTGNWSKVLYHTKGRQQAAIYGGPQGPNDFYSYSMAPTGGATSYYLTGQYKLDVTTTVNGKALHASATITLACG